MSNKNRKQFIICKKQEKVLCEESITSKYQWYFEGDYKADDYIKLNKDRWNKVDNDIQPLT